LRRRRKKNKKIHCQALQISNSILGTQETAGPSTLLKEDLDIEKKKEEE
jgi:hypothetical protein